MVCKKATKALGSLVAALVDELRASVATQICFGTALPAVTSLWPNDKPCDSLAADLETRHRVGGIPGSSPGKPNNCIYNHIYIQLRAHP